MHEGYKNLDKSLGSIIMPFIEFIFLMCLLVILGLFFYIPQITQYSQSGGAKLTDNNTEMGEGPYLRLAHKALKETFDHQVEFESHNSWVNVSFENMRLFEKNYIWPTLLKRMPRTEAKRLHPSTYNLPDHVSELMQLETPPYILKQSDKWGREGLLIVDSNEDLTKHMASYDIAQPLLKNPDLINKYKYDIRMFLVVHYKHGVLLHRVGYFSFSNNPYDYHSKDMLSRIGGVHLTAEFYKNNGLPTTTDTYPGYQAYYSDIVSMMQRIMSAYPHPLLTSDEIVNKRIKVFGIDINIFKDANDKLTPILIEMNSNPCLLFPEAEWKNKLIYELVSDIQQEAIDKFSILRKN